MKLNRKFLGILLGFGLVSSFSFAVSAATSMKQKSGLHEVSSAVIMPPTNSVDIFYKGKGKNARFYEKTNVKDALVVFTVFNKALKNSGKANKLAYSSLMDQMFIMFGPRKNGKEKIYGPAVPTNINIELSGKMGEENYKGKTEKEIKKQNKKINDDIKNFVEYANKVKSRINEEDFNNAKNSIENIIKHALDNENYNRENEKEHLEKVLKGIKSVRFKDVENKFKSLDLKLHKAPRMGEKEYDEVVKKLSEIKR